MKGYDGSHIDLYAFTSMGCVQSSRKVEEIVMISLAQSVNPMLHLPVYASVVNESSYVVDMDDLSLSPTESKLSKFFSDEEMDERETYKSVFSRMLQLRGRSEQLADKLPKLSEIAVNSYTDGSDASLNFSAGSTIEL